MRRRKKCSIKGCRKQNKDEDSSSQTSEQELYASEDELRIANDFLDKFLIQSESSVDGQIDLPLVIKALPDNIKNYSITRVQLFNFRIFQDSLLAHQNTEIVDAFEYFDKRNKERVYAIKDTLLSQKKELAKVRESLCSVQGQLEQRDDPDPHHPHPRASSAFSKKRTRKKLFFDDIKKSEQRKPMSKTSQKARISEGESEEELKQNMSRNLDF